MTTPLYKVVFSGELMPGFTLDNVKSYLATLFKADLKKIDSLFTGKTVELKRELTEAEADKYVGVLRNAGALVHKESYEVTKMSLTDIDQLHSATATIPATEIDPMKCPKCGHEQVKAIECAECGVIIDKFIARQTQQATTALPVEISAAPKTKSTPYAPPHSVVGEELPEFAQLKVLSTDGRIGRLRYLAWSLCLTMAGFAALMLAVGGYFVTPAIGYLLGAVTVISAITVGIMIGVQRLHDIGWSGWLLLLTLIPYLGSLFSLILMLMPGSKGANRFGAPPPENSTAVKALAGMWLLLVAIGVLGAILVPDLQQYMPAEK